MAFHSDRGEGDPGLQAGVGPRRTEGRGTNPVPTFPHPGFQARVDPSAHPTYDLTRPSTHHSLQQSNHHEFAHSLREMTAEVDLELILKTSGIIAEQRQLKDILEKILDVLIESAGADTAAILIRDLETQEFLIEGLTEMGGEKTILNHGPWKGHTKLPEMVIRMVIHSNGTMVSIPDISANQLQDRTLLNDPAISSRSPKCLLCFSIQHQGQILAVVYIENRSMTHCFTEHRIRFLKLLSLQMAISIENGQVFSKLERLVEKKTEEVRRQTQRLVTVFNAIQQGIFVFGPDFRCQADFSPHLKDIVGLQNPEGHNLLDILFEEFPLDRKNQILASLSNSFDEPKEFGWRLNSWLLPREAKRQNRVYEMDWEAMEKDCQVNSIMLIVRDITHLRKLEAESKDRKLQLEITSQILEAGPDVVREFLQSSQRYLEGSIQALIKQPIDRILIFRNLHTIKGNARSLGFTELAVQAHETETKLENLSSDSSVLSTSEVLRDCFRPLEYLLEKCRVVLNRICSNEFVTSVSKALAMQLQDQDELKSLTHSLSRSLEDLAKLLGKEAPRLSYANRTQTPIQLDSKLRAVLKDCFIHLFRNCLDHGIETAEVRQTRGKPPMGTITVELVSAHQICVKDDGAGLNLRALRSLRKLGPSASDLEVANTIFLSGVSTAQNITEISGRGVGMEAVKSFLEEAGCSIELKWIAGKEGDEFRSFEFNIQLPH